MLSYANRDMRGYFRDVVDQKKYDYSNFISPILAGSGFNMHEVDNMFNNNQIRIRWGRDWRNFTIHFDNPINDPTWKLDELVHSIWKNQIVPNCLIATCFLPERGRGPVSSMAITDLYTLANGMRNHGVVHKIRNGFNGQSFMTLPFSHHSLANNIWKMGA